MKHSKEVKENIIKATTELIRQSTGNIAEITTRAIAQRANVGIGLINYHFQSKEKLITICVQRIIEQVILNFSMEERNYQNEEERLTDWAVYVFDFLFENDAISRISILGDMFDYTMDSNSVKTQKGFLFAMGEAVGDSDKKMVSFILTSAMQTAFLSRKVSRELLGYDFNIQEERKAFITKLVRVLMKNGKKGEMLL